MSPREAGRAVEIELKKDAAGLVTVVVQDRLTGELRMLAHADEEALRRTRETGLACFYSRSRGRPWQKGEESGNVLHVREIWIDCDADAVVYLVDPEGPSCHTGAPSCFFRRLDGGDPDGGDPGEGGRALPLLPRLEAALRARQEGERERSYTRSLLEKGPAKIGEKLREEAGELAAAIAEESDARVTSEAADLLYHTLVALLSRGLSLREVEAELARRFGVSGLDEKEGRGRA